MSDLIPEPESGTLAPREERRLTAAEFHRLRDVPPEVEWFANIRNENTKRAYMRDLKTFTAFAGIERPGEFAMVTRAHVIAWRDELGLQGLAPATIRRKMSALASLFDFLCEKHSVETNPVHGAARPNEGANVGKTAAISDDQALRVLDAPAADTLLGIRDRAILRVLLFHGLRRQELCDLRVGDLQEREGMPHLQVRGKGEKLRYLPLEAGSLRRIREYLEKAGHGDDRKAPLFQRTRGNDGRALHPTTVYQRIVKRYAREVGMDPDSVSTHSLRATAATSAIEGGSDLEKVRDWLGHAHIGTTTLYDKRNHRAEDSPTFAVNYRRKHK